MRRLSILFVLLILVLSVSINVFGFILLDEMTYSFSFEDSYSRVQDILSTSDFNYGYFKNDSYYMNGVDTFKGVPVSPIFTISDTGVVVNVTYISDLVDYDIISKNYCDDMVSEVMSVLTPLYDRCESLVYYKLFLCTRTCSYNSDALINSLDAFLCSHTYYNIVASILTFLNENYYWFGIILLIYMLCLLSAFFIKFLKPVFLKGKVQEKKYVGTISKKVSIFLKYLLWVILILDIICCILYFVLF